MAIDSFRRKGLYANIPQMCISFWQLQKVGPCFNSYKYGAHILILNDGPHVEMRLIKREINKDFPEEQEEEEEANVKSVITTFQQMQGKMVT